MTIYDQIRELPETDFRDLKNWIVTDETARRQQEPAIRAAKQEAEAETATKIAQQLAEEHPDLVEKPTETDGGEVRAWEAWHPLKKSTHFRYGDKAQHNGKIWRDVLDPTGDTLNVWEPGAEGIDERYWQEVVDDKPATEQADEEAPATPTPAAKEPDGTKENPFEFKAGLNVTPGQYVTYQGVTYKVVQGHTTASHWAPPDVASLFAKD